MHDQLTLLVRVRTVRTVDHIGHITGTDGRSRAQHRRQYDQQRERHVLAKVTRFDRMETMNNREAFADKTYRSHLIICSPIVIVIHTRPIAR